MDCKTARLLLEFARPGSAELQGSEAEALENHLGSCADCDALARTERELDNHVGRAVRDVPVPDRLRGRVLERVRTERRKRRRGVLAWGARAAVAAAVLVLAAWGIFSWHRGRLPDVDVSVAHLHDFVIQSADREKVEEWFREDYNVTISAPASFNYGLLKSFNLVPYQGKQVPALLFVHENHRARVYILSDKEFNLSSLDMVERSDSGGLTVEVWRPSANPQVAYLIVYTGNSLHHFLTEEQRHAA